MASTISRFRRSLEQRRDGVQDLDRLAAMPRADSDGYAEEEGYGRRGDESADAHACSHSKSSAGGSPPVFQVSAAASRIPTHRRLLNSPREMDVAGGGSPHRWY